MHRENGKLRLTRLEAQRIFVDDHRARGVLITQPLSIESDNKPGKGYYLNGGNMKLVRLLKGGEVPYAVVSAR